MHHTLRVTVSYLLGLLLAACYIGPAVGLLVLTLYFVA